MKQFCTALIIACLTLPSLAFSQQTTKAAAPNPYQYVDQRMDQKNDSLGSLGEIASFIKATFTKDADKARAIFDWLTRNMEYSAQAGYVSTNDSYCSVVKNAFQRKTGVCMDYAALFDTLGRLTGLTTHIVEGSTRQTFLTSVIGHAWNAVKIDGSWQLLDATWGSGYFNKEAFVKERSDFFFLTPPEKLIETHLPMDPIWQLLRHPVTLREFQENKPSTSKTDWNYNDSIAAYLKQSPIEQVKSNMRRLKAFGINSEVTANYYTYLKSRETEYYTQLFNAAVKDDNEAVIRYNAYVKYKNRQFEPLRSDRELSKIMPAIDSLLTHSQAVYRQIAGKSSEAELNSAISTNLKHVTELRTRVKTETEFVNKYLGTPKNKRRDLFYTRN